MSTLLGSSWADALEGEFNKPYFLALKDFLVKERTCHTVYPPRGQVFAAFAATSLPAVRVVIFGQDPYHGAGQAQGLCFSVPEGVRVPPSLNNIYKELAQDVGFKIPAHGCLENWARQGVLLLNSVLTVVEGRAGAHQGKGWEQFTDEVVALVNQHCEHVVFMLWGAYAQKKGAAIDPQRHLILRAPHPSPLSAQRGFFGCGHFSKANAYLVEHGYAPIDWQV
ncbi:MAG: uracil-DNA glycosylase [Gammaproteobacteria bacterium]|nr:MAG: uracil-DNA glycosylase [Gammaproteobacteria bacterium]